MVDVVYIAASTLDARLTRICVASVRHFYPAVRVRLLVGGPLQAGLTDQLRRHFDVCPAASPRGTYGWGFVKLEPLFGPPGERFLVLDSDTVMTGPVLSIADQIDDDFIVNEERHAPDQARTLYYDPAQAPIEGRTVVPPAFLFNSGQWFGRSGVLSRGDFDGLVRWELPRVLIRPESFMGGDQGILNFVVNEQARLGRVRVARVPLMRWPGHGLAGLDAATVAAGSTPPAVIHWAGMKTTLLRTMVGAEILDYFERRYYAQLPFGELRRAADVAQHLATLKATPLIGRLRRRRC